jgi:hypothetical protein
LSSFPSRLRETLRAWRIEHPGWEPKTLRAELENVIITLEGHDRNL